MSWAIVAVERMLGEDHAYRIEVASRDEESVFATVRMGWKSDAGTQVLARYEVSHCANADVVRWLWDSPDDRSDEIDAVLRAPEGTYAYRVAMAGASHEELADFGSRELSHAMAAMENPDPTVIAIMRRAWASAMADEDAAQEEAAALDYVPHHALGECG